MIIRSDYSFKLYTYTATPTPIPIPIPIPRRTTTRRRSPPTTPLRFLRVWSYQSLNVPSSILISLSRASVTHPFVSRSVFSSPYTIRSARYTSSPLTFHLLQWSPRSLTHPTTTALRRQLHFKVNWFVKSILCLSFCYFGVALDNYWELQEEELERLRGLRKRRM